MGTQSATVQYDLVGGGGGPPTLIDPNGVDNTLDWVENVIEQSLSTKKRK